MTCRWRPSCTLVAVAMLLGPAAAAPLTGPAFGLEVWPSARPDEPDRLLFRSPQGARVLPMSRARGVEATLRRLPDGSWVALGHELALFDGRGWQAAPPGAWWVDREVAVRWSGPRATVWWPDRTCQLRLPRPWRFASEPADANTFRAVRAGGGGLHLLASEAAKPSRWHRVWTLRPHTCRATAGDAFHSPAFDLRLLAMPAPAGGGAMLWWSQSEGQLAFSSDGRSWALRSLPPDTQQLLSVHLQDGAIWAAVSDTGSQGGLRLFTASGLGGAWAPVDPARLSSDLAAWWGAQVLSLEQAAP
jgi:hypothetical protein